MGMGGDELLPNSLATQIPRPPQPDPKPSPEDFSPPRGLVEIGASSVVLWELSGTGEHRQRRALRLIGVAFVVLALYITVQSVVVIVTGFHPKHSPLGIAWTAMTAVVMFSLAAGKARTGAALGNPVLQTEGRVTFIDGLLATAVLFGLTLNAVAGAWWADPLAGLLIVFYGLREANTIFRGD
jgi:hypothetical protein